MNLLSFVLGLPFAPVRGVIAVAEVIRQQVEHELFDPSVARRQLEQVAAMAEAGELSGEQRKQAEQEIVQRLVAQPLSPPTITTTGGTERPRG